MKSINASLDIFEITCTPINMAYRELEDLPKKTRLGKFRTRELEQGMHIKGIKIHWKLNNPISQNSKKTKTHIKNNNLDS